MKEQSYRLYGRQKSGPLTKEQEELFQHFLPNLDVDIQELSKAKRAVLEIGFGSGEHLSQRALLAPQDLFIGCEPFINGIASLLMKIEAQNIKNIRIHNADVRQLYEELPDQAFDEIYLLFPDPWPKKRHWKRRFIQENTFIEMSRILKPGGVWYIATDHPSYQVWIEQLLNSKNALEYFEDIQKDRLEAWPHFVSTRYHQKALRENRISKYFALKVKKK